MSWNIAYKGSFLNAESDIDNNDNQKQVDIWIYDTESGVADDPTTIIPLEMADNPLTLEYVNNDEDKFNVFVSLRAEIKVHSSDTISIDTFSEGGDNRYYTEVYYGSDIKFKGWLSISDLSQEFQPDPNVITFIANDGLGFLEAEALTDFDGDNPMNENSLMDYLCWALAKTGLQLNIAAIFNIRESTAPPIDNTLTASATFASSPNEFILAITYFFEVGGTYQITGTSLNNQTFTVSGVGQTIVTIVQGGTFVNEGPVSATFTKIGATVGSGHIFKHEYVDAKTFEKGIGVSEDCKTIIDKILKREARIMQVDGEWVIVRIDELQYGDTLKLFRFDYLGVFVEVEDVTFIKEIGVDELCGWMDDDTIKSLERPVKSIKLTLNYSYPSEIPCNPDFSRGDFIADLPDEVIESKTYQAKSYQLDCWENARHKSNGNANLSADSDVYIKRLFYNGAETDRYIHYDRGATTENSLKSSKIYVAKDDKITVGVTARYDIDTDQVTRNIALELVGDDGTYWYAAQFNNRLLWFQYPAGNNPIIFISNPDIDEIDYTEWQSVSYESEAMPVTGVLYCYLYLDIVDTMAWIEYSDFNLTAIPFINGSYRRVTGQYYRVTQPTSPEKYKAIIEDEVFIGELPRRSMKGALLKYDPDNSVYIQASGFYNAGVFPSGPPDSTYVHPYGWIQIYDNWNQYSRTMRKFDGTIDRFDAGNDIPNPLHRYHLTDINASTTGKEFISLHAKQNVLMCETEIFLHEVDDDAIGKTYPPNEFKYITNA